MRTNHMPPPPPLQRKKRSIRLSTDAWYNLEKVAQFWTKLDAANDLRRPAWTEQSVLEEAVRRFLDVGIPRRP